ncbi:MAG TPA: potassium channel protein [Oscillatoriaceae cyanobacterium M33_DOE_052]|uniref:Potassium channel protein n=1 Tax=Planktothricoides sp. SpSt-374 TaxID=2282167 RepID=A0A7C3ZN70_9CYAN|nr:potassium channel protein [Oscillatoriaceae cyanobacterium M33_DOE_052]
MASSLEQKYKKIRQELVGSILVLVGVFIFGTAGYCVLEGWKVSEAAYMTVITLSTVGFSEVHPLNDDGRLFTVSLIALGLISIGYIVNRFTEAIIQGYFQEVIKLRQQKRLLDTLSKHYILCGFGRTGRQIALEFQAEGIPFVIVDAKAEAVEMAGQMDYIAFQGDATEDITLMKVGIDRAVCLVVALPSDAENLYILISAKTLNPKLRTVARANTEEASRKLQRSGADAVISPYITGGRRMAAAALRPQVMDFVDGIITGTDRSLYLEEFRIQSENFPFEGQTLRSARLRLESGALVLAIRRSGGELIGGPTAETLIGRGDTLICMGTAEQLRRLNQLLDPLDPVNSQALRLPKQGTHYGELEEDEGSV